MQLVPEFSCLIYIPIIPYSLSRAREGIAEPAEANNFKVEQVLLHIFPSRRANVLRKHARLLGPHGFLIIDLIHTERLIGPLTVRLLITILDSTAYGV